MTHLTRQPPVVLGSGEPYRLFNRFQVETTSDCNRACSFCPVSTGRRDFPRRSMDPALYSSIVRQLADLGFSGVLQLFLLNEPLLDPLLEDRLREARSALPKCTIYLSTNGDPVDHRGARPVSWSVDRLMRVYEAGATTVNLNVYDAGEEQLERYRGIVDALVATGRVRVNRHRYNRAPLGKYWVALTDMRPERLTASSVDMFHHRTDEDREGDSAPRARCARTQRHMVVRYDGTVPICCAVDPTSPDLVVAGDLNSQTIIEVWNSEIMFKYRWYTQQGRRELPGCDRCGHRMAYPHLVRRVDAPAEAKERWARSLQAWRARRPLPVLAGAS